MVRLARNTGPAGGFRAGLQEAFADPDVRWAYLCEDDVGLFDLPAPRIGPVLDRVDRLERPAARPIGAVVAYGRSFVGRGAHTVNVVPPAGRPDDLSLRSTWPAGARPWCRGRCSRPGVLPDADVVLRARGLRLLLPGARGRLRGAGGRRGRPRRWPDSRRRPAGPEAHRRGATRRRRRGVARPTTTPGTRSSWPAATADPSWYAWHLAYSAPPSAAGPQRGRAVGHRARPVGRCPRPDGRESPLRRDVGEFAAPGGDPVPSGDGPSAR